ncbi:MAG TPA: penicillin-binding protein 1C [Caldithrix abyssi]|uniref:peptidoglycan glycosyltransferase n=1 Tax=Caldithrix abyssi TaxID=187145 RepID=A0A7V5RNY8_CALAY|nr:penicillin-binding protein 1C [Caldithrix abyssi]
MSAHPSRVRIVPGSRAWSVFLAAAALFLLAVLGAPVPRPLFDAPYSTTLRAADGSLLGAALAGDEQWRFPASDSLPGRFATAIRLFEDEYFYYHPGINPVSLFRAARQNMRAGKIVSGGSTITMQLVRMAYGHPPRTYLQKFREMLAALKLELLYSKEEILTLYIDHAPFGGNIVGIKAAAWRYFGRDPQQLSWAEAAFLAILPNQPSMGFSAAQKEYLLRKRNRLLKKLARRGYISNENMNLARGEPLPERRVAIPRKATHLLYRAINEGHRGETIRSTLERRLQEWATRRLNRYSRKMAANQVHNAAALILDIATGHTLAYVGNARAGDEHAAQVDVITARRSPGSLLKPVLYAAALDEGLILPRQLLPDIPVIYQGFAPKNFDRRYRGAVPADQALAGSLNVPFVHLLRAYGYEKLHRKLRNMGMRSLSRPAAHYGLSLILGGAETSLWELSAVYAGMARSYLNYARRPLNRGYSPADYHPNIYVKGEEPGRQTEPGPNALLRAPSIGFALRAMQMLRRPREESGWEQFGSSRSIAWKTGTSIGFRDAWAMGMNERYLVAVWLGNADGEGRPGLTGIQAAAPLMFDLFGLLEGGARFDESLGSPVRVCARSGMHPSENCPQTVWMDLPDYLREGPVCPYHRLLHLNADSSARVNSSCYPVRKMKTVSWFILPPVMARYYRARHTAYREPPPFLASCRQEPDGRPMALVYPRRFTRIYIPLEQDGRPGRAVFEAAHRQGEAVIYWHLDEEYLGYTRRPHKMALSAEKGPHRLTLIDDSGHELRIAFEVINE